ncbi:unnamed protein product [Rotaria sordida]|uniref:Uncharacterized protein n=1 Tax=Rotaria sordida TaxID=392033 RepID=A0A813T2Y0_9BILA|nr:unnamed protein product [Rotaria sordida]
MRKCEEGRAAPSNEICLINIEERKTIVNKLIHSAKNCCRVCVENKYCRLEPYRPSTSKATFVDEIFSRTHHMQCIPTFSDDRTSVTVYFVELEEIIEENKYKFRIIACNQVDQPYPKDRSRIIVAKNSFSMSYDFSEKNMGTRIHLPISAIGNEWFDLN